MHKCSCKDKNGICKHIHKIHSKRVRRFLPDEHLDQESNDSNSADEEPFVSYHTEIVKEDYKEKDSKILLGRAVSALEKNSDHLNDENVKKIGLSHICHALEDLNLKCETFKNTQKQNNSEFQIKDVIQPNSKIQRIAPKLKKMRSTQNPRQSNQKKLILKPLEVLRLTGGTSAYYNY